jgi:uncharacterized coiled-coil protein SlyX
MENSDLDKTRIDELESRLTQQDHSILELSDEMYRQQQQIAQLEIKVRHLAERLQRAGPEESAGDAVPEIPPHY